MNSEHAITSAMQSQLRDGLLRQQNQRRWASYRVAEDAPQSVDDSPHSTGDSPQWAANFPHLSEELLSLAEPARDKARLPAAETKALVMRLCDARWLTFKDLAALLNRNAETCKAAFLVGW